MLHRPDRGVPLPSSRDVAPEYVESIGPPTPCQHGEHIDRKRRFALIVLLPVQVDQVRLDRTDIDAKCECDVAVVLVACLDLPVLAWVVGHALNDGRRGNRRINSQRVTKALAAPSLEQAEQRVRRCDFLRNGRDSSCPDNRRTTSHDTLPRPFY